MSLAAIVFVAVMFAGLAMVAVAVRESRHTMWRRVAPYVGTGIESRSTVTALDTAFRRAASTRFGWAWGTDHAIVGKCRTAGGAVTLRGLRLRQMTHAGLATAAVIAWAGLRILTHPSTPIAPLLVVVAAAPLAGGWWVRARLDTAVARRAREMDAQLPTVLELLAFAIASGESMHSALDRVTRTAGGVLPDCLRTAVRSIATGQPVAEALRDVSASTTSPAVNRATRAIEVALDRGTPLAEVLRSQAADARAHHMRQMLVLAGKKETVMMLPVVFLILPMIVAVAIYPGLAQLQVW